jgi:predicted N-formylglutamate amidohydrolase
MRVLRPEGKSRFVLFCDHASNHVPAELNGLGLPASELERHIAYDIGAAGVTEVLSEEFDAPAVLSGFSRLVIDCNRHLDAADLIPEVSDGTEVPGNRDVDREQRIAAWFRPYHDAVEAILDERKARGIASITVSVHSMTPSLSSGKAAGQFRPWQISLSSYRDRSLTGILLRELRAKGDAEIGDNQPYDLDPAVDYSTPYHALRRGLQHVQVEFRQDEIATPEGQRQWALRFAKALRALELH